MNDDPRKTAKVSSSTGTSKLVTVLTKLSTMKNPMVSRMVKALAWSRGRAAHCLNWETTVFIGTPLIIFCSFQLSIDS